MSGDPGSNFVVLRKSGKEERLDVYKCEYQLWEDATPGASSYSYLFLLTLTYHAHGRWEMDIGESGNLLRIMQVVGGDQA